MEVIRLRFPQYSTQQVERVRRWLGSEADRHESMLAAWRPDGPYHRWQRELILEAHRETSEAEHKARAMLRVYLYIFEHEVLEPHLQLQQQLDLSAAFGDEPGRNPDSEGEDSDDEESTEGVEQEVQGDAGQDAGVRLPNAKTVRLRRLVKQGHAAEAVQFGSFWAEYASHNRGGGRHNRAFAKVDHRQQVRQAICRSSASPLATESGGGGHSSSQALPGQRALCTYPRPARIARLLCE
eukprot:SAG11_NODE_3101_length_2690_cov_4.351216_3_plen_239_part_00